MFADSIIKLLPYFVRSMESNKTTIVTAIAPTDEVPSLYEIVENGLKDNVSIALQINIIKSHVACSLQFYMLFNSSAPNRYSTFYTIHTI